MHIHVLNIVKMYEMNCCKKKKEEKRKQVQVATPYNINQK